jgi:branched-chain amino acid aminotransferase
MARGAKVWFNGKIVAAEEARVSLFTHGLHYGTGAFEGIRAYKQKGGGGAVFRLREHLERLEDSLKILDVKVPYSVDDLIQATVATCKANGFEECYIRPLAFLADSGSLSVNPGSNPPVDLAILNWEWGHYLGDKGMNEGARLKISSFIRPQPNSVMTKGKITGQYVTGVLAKREAISLGFEEAVVLDPEGYVAEGTGENLFIVKDGRVKTCPLGSILSGITRHTVLEYFRSKGIAVQESRFTRDELWCADEIFLTGTAAEITPVREIDGRAIGRGARAGRPGELTLRLKQDYAALVRGADKPEWARGWLTPIA